MRFSSNVVLGYAAADFDAVDVVLFRTSSREDGGLDVEFESGGANGGFIVDAKALEGAKGMLSIEQGAMLALGAAIANGARVTNAVPPFLLPRKVFRAARAGKSVSWTTSRLDEATELTLAGTSVLAIERDGAKVDVPCVKLAGDDLAIWVADDAEWPWVLRATEVGGDNGWIALAAGEGVDRARLLVLEQELDEADPSVTPIEQAPPAGTKANDPVALLLKHRGIVKKAAEKKVIEAIRACGGRKDPASLDALFATLGTDNVNVSNAITHPLRLRGEEPGFVEKATAVLAEALRDAPPFSPEPNAIVTLDTIPPAVRVASTLPSVLGPAHLADPALRQALHAAAEHPSRWIRGRVTAYLTSSDPEFAATLLDKTDLASTTASGDWELASTYVRTLLALRAPEEVSTTLTPHLKSLPVEEARQIFDRALSSVPERDARWLPVLRGWSELGRLERGFAIDEKLRRIKRNTSASANA